MTHKFESGIHDLAVCKYSNFCFITFTYWTPNNILDFLIVCPFSPGGFFTFLLVLAHGAPPGCHCALLQPLPGCRLSVDDNDRLT